MEFFFKMNVRDFILSGTGILIEGIKIGNS